MTTPADDAWVAEDPTLCPTCGREACEDHLPVETAPHDGNRDARARQADVPEKGRRLCLEIDGVAFEATQITQVEGVVRAVVAASTGTRVWHRDGPVSLTSARTRAQFLGRVAAARDSKFGPAVDPLLELEATIRLQGLGQETSAPSGLPGNPFEHSNSSPEVEWTPALAALLVDSNLFERLSNTLRRQGWVGNRRPPLMAYLALTSRLLDRPINLAFVSQAAAGKNHAINVATALMPPEAFYFMGAASERALIYTGESFQQRVVIFGEADSIPDEGPVASAVRSLASDNVLRYDVVEQNPKTNRFETRRIEKPGPTGLMTTSTRSLQLQLDTRVLEIAVPDHEKQTRLIMRAQAG